jgi:hypothetical protein
MASIPQIRGALLEEIVLLLLDRSGYRRVQAGEEGTRNGRAGLEVEGRGSLHQIDALVTPLHSHAFIYPIRLMVEAKCEAKRVRLSTVRSVVGTLFDINQNYFARPLLDGREVRMQRFNYHAAIFGANGYKDFLFIAFYADFEREKEIWRRGWDSNPRARFWQATRFRGGLFQPLRHLSATRKSF